MRRDRLVDQLTHLREMLREIEQRIPSEQAPREAVEELKMAVDHLRMTLWAILSTTTTEESLTTPLIARFRIRRTVEMHEKITRDIKSGDLTHTAPELPLLHTSLSDVLKSVRRLYTIGAE